LIKVKVLNIKANKNIVFDGIKMLSGGETSFKIGFTQRTCRIFQKTTRIHKKQTTSM